MTDDSPERPVEASEDDDGGFAARLRAAREERGFTQGQVAARAKGRDSAGRGVSRTAVIAYEQGATKPGIRELRLLCDVLHVTPNWLIYGSDSASTALLPGLELLQGGAAPPDARDLVTLATALLILKGHERDALLTMALSLAGRQVGDGGVSSLMITGRFIGPKFVELLQREFPDHAGGSLESLAEALAGTWTSNAGTRYRLDEEGEILNPAAAVYADPHKKS